jgi:hypothetical protein
MVRTCTRQIGEDELRAAVGYPGLTGGEYVCLEVLDDGCGMDEATCFRALPRRFWDAAWASPLRSGS